MLELHNSLINVAVFIVVGVRDDVVAETSLPVFRLASLTNTWIASPLTCDLFRGLATYLSTFVTGLPVAIQSQNELGFSCARLPI